jgi:N-acetylglucosaminyl-diphospho-decaprenol L-rhamnosyltransferase
VIVPPALDLVIVSFNAREDLARCLASIAAHPPARPHTVIVVDNASEDGSAALVARQFPAVRLVALDENRGFARGCNAGIRAGRGELVLLLNSDTIVPAGALDRLAVALERTPEAAAAGPRLVDAEGRPELSFGRMMGPWNEFRQKLVGRLYTRGVPPVAGWIEALTRRRHFPDWVSGACLLVWRADAEAVGLLDERYFMYAEDVDFCAALRARGRRILFEPGAEVVHLRGRSRAAAAEATRRAYRRSQLAFYAKHHPRWRPWLAAYLRLKGEL